MSEEEKLPICKSCKRPIKAIKKDKKGRYSHAGKGGCGKFVSKKLKDNPAITVFIPKEEAIPSPLQVAPVEEEKMKSEKEKGEEAVIEKEEIAAPDIKKIFAKEEDVSDVRGEFERLIEGKEGVVGVGIGETSAGKTGLIVEVKEKTPELELTLPKIFKGYPVGIEERRGIQPLTREKEIKRKEPIATTREGEEGEIKAEKEKVEEGERELTTVPIRLSKAVRRLTDRKWGLFFEGPIRRATREWLAEKVPRRVAIASSGVTLQDSVVASPEEAKAFIIYDPKKVPAEFDLADKDFVVIQNPGKDIFSVLAEYEVEAIIVNSEKYRDDTAFRVIEGSVKDVIERSKE